MRHARRWAAAHLADPLFRQSYLLLVATGISAASGLLFWVLAARRLTAHDVGVAAGYLAAVSCLSYLTSFALPYGILRFGSRPDGSSAVNAAFIFSATTSVTASVIFTLGAFLWTPGLTSLLHGPARVALFVACNTAVALGLLLDNLFAVRRVGQLAIVRAAISGVGKLVLLPVLATHGAVGIAIAFFAPVVVGTVVLLAVLEPVVPGFRRGAIGFDAVTRDLFRFSLRTFPGSLLAGAPPFLLPLLVFAIDGARATAYFYVAWNITLVLQLVPNVVSHLALSEGAANVESADVLIKARRFGLALTLPAVVVVWLGTATLLGFYGPAYVQHAAWPLRLFALSAVPWVFVTIRVSALRIAHRHTDTTALTTVFCIAALGLAVLGDVMFGIVGVAIGWLVASVIAAAVAELWLPARPSAARAPAAPVAL